MRLFFFFFFFLISDVEDKIKTVEEFTEAICLELDEKLMQEELG